MEVLIIGGGIGGLTLALSLHEASIPCRIFEAAPTIMPLGVGINILPHASREFAKLGLEKELAAAAVTTQEMCYYNRFGQFIYKEPRGRFAGYDCPQFSIHRAALHSILLHAVRERLGPDAIVLAHKCVGTEQSSDDATAFFADSRTGAVLSSHRGRAIIGCDGIHSVVRRQLFPNGGQPCFEGINMWRGVTRWKPFLTGASMILAGWLQVGKMVIYPIENQLNAQGRQLITWAAEIQVPQQAMLDWNVNGKLDDFYPIFATWNFPWLDVAGLIRHADMILEYPMVDRDPLTRWTSGRATLLGDAAHPMYPRGANGAAQAVLDARALARWLEREQDAGAALMAYENERLQPANKVVLANRSAPSDYLLKVIHDRSEDRPFNAIEDIISRDEMISITEDYKQVAGFDRRTLNSR